MKRKPTDDVLVQRALAAITEVNSLSYTLHCVREQLATAKIKLRNALDELKPGDKPEHPAVAHWRLNLGDPSP